MMHDYADRLDLMDDDRDIQGYPTAVMSEEDRRSELDE